MNYSLELNDNYFKLIKTGAKTVEGRTPSDDNDKRYSDMTVNDTLTFTSNVTGERCVCNILSVSNYPDVRSMLESVGIERALPGIKNIDEGINIYHSLNGYEERIKKYGIYGIEIKVGGTR